MLVVVALLSVLAAIALVELIRHGGMPRLLRAAALASVGLWLLVGIAINWRAHGDAILAVTGIEDRGTYVDEQLRNTGFNWYRDFQKLNTLLPEDANVLILETRGYYLNRDYVKSIGLTRGMATKDEVRSPKKLLAVLGSLGVTHAAWDPASSFDSTIRDTLVASGCTSPVFESETILVSRIGTGSTCLH